MSQYLEVLESQIRTFFCRQIWTWEEIVQLLQGHYLNIFDLVTL